MDDAHLPNFSPLPPSALGLEHDWVPPAVNAADGRKFFLALIHYSLRFLAVFVVSFIFLDDTMESPFLFNTM
jgi:hypothetical protein